MVDEARAFQMTVELYTQVRSLQEQNAELNARLQQLGQHNAELDARVQELVEHNGELVKHIATYEGVQTPDG